MNYQESPAGLFSKGFILGVIQTLEYQQKQLPEHAVTEEMKRKAVKTVLTDLNFNEEATEYWLDYFFE